MAFVSRWRVGVVSARRLGGIHIEGVVGYHALCSIASFVYRLFSLRACIVASGHGFLDRHVFRGWHVARKRGRVCRALGVCVAARRSAGRRLGGGPSAEGRHHTFAVFRQSMQRPTVGALDLGAMTSYAGRQPQSAAVFGLVHSCAFSPNMAWSSS